MQNKQEVAWLLKEKYSGRPTKAFYRDIERLKIGVPLDYVIGFTEFLGCRINLSKKPLIPRPETEFWVQKTITHTLTNSSLSGCSGCKKIKVLDVFSGSGCIGIAVLKYIKNVNVVFADNDKKCIEQTKINLSLNSNSQTNLSLIRANKRFVRKKRYVVVKSDVFSNIKGKFDYIFANPPYIPKKNKNKVQKSVLKYEPEKALFGGSDGLFYVKKFLKQAKDHLNKNGVIFMEFDPPQKKEITKLLKKYKYSNWKFHKDQYNKWRWVGIR